MCVALWLDVRPRIKCGYVCVLTGMSAYEQLGAIVWVCGRLVIGWLEAC